MKYLYLILLFLVLLPFLTQALIPAEVLATQSILCRGPGPIFTFNKAKMMQEPSQRRIASEARAVVGLLARELGCCMLSDVGRLFKRDVGSISSAVRRLSERMQKDSELAERVTFLKKELEPYLNNWEA